MSELGQRLDEAAAALADKGNPQCTVRTLIGWAGARRRGYWIVKEVREALSKRGLVTDPDFESSYIDGTVRIVRVSSTESASAESSYPDFSGSGSAEHEFVTGGYSDPVPRIRMLVAANKVPLSVPPDATIREATTLMMARDYSQLPVMTGPRHTKGLVSWKSIATHRALGKPCEFVRDCMETPRIIPAETTLFDAVREIVRGEVVLVCASPSDPLIQGLVTTTDLGVQFRTLAEPFLLIGEVENHIRRLMDGRFKLAELQLARDSGDSDRVVESLADLTFGEYVRLLENNGNWEKLKVPLDRALIVKELHEVRRIRNDVMHFDPDGISEEDLDRLRECVRFLQAL